MKTTKSPMESPIEFPREFPKIGQVVIVRYQIQCDHCREPRCVEFAVTGRSFTAWDLGYVYGPLGTGKISWLEGKWGYTESDGTEGYNVEVKVVE